MSKREQKKNENDSIAEKLLENVQTLYAKNKTRIIAAKDENPNKRIAVKFDVVIDTSAAIPSVGTTIGYVVPTVEDGARVKRSYKMSIAGEAEDPDQIPLFPKESEPEPAPDATAPKEPKKKAAKKSGGKKKAKAPTSDPDKADIMAEPEV